MNPRRHAGGTLLGLFLGLVLGVLIAAGVVWYFNRTPPPFQAKVQKPPPEKAAAAPAAPEPLPGKPGERAGEKPRFEFYRILPGAQEPVPPPAAAAGARPAAAEALYLQAGAFQNPADADNLKARLALLGVEASVQAVTLPEKGLVHRVRVGPFASAEALAETRALLAENGIQAGVVRVKDGKEAAN